ncbi:hypothetical protein EIP91_010013 [Steccherinum ochraceum]|uniref:BTB domain-containing protein n=1 Tax=Steccherinum ochraceum TaxID=92696 RepID=A0A4R0RT58_9APHY|nr:hypothetical protein EIP91_010013 [Steccherinum ochraceum]
MSTPPPAKRSRTDDSLDADPSGLESARSNNYGRGEIWLDDGNVVLVAEGMAFKVHKSTLALNSEVFRDMFTIPQPADAEMWEGCPVVHLQDSKKDLLYILRALFDTRNTSWFAYGSKLPFTVVSAMLRLGSKYQILQLRHDAIRRLSECFPSCLDHFRNYYTDGTPLDNDDEIQSNSIHVPTINMCIAVINLARSFDLPQLLPPAFYLSAMMENEVLVPGWTDEDGNHWQLSPQDLVRSLNGRAELHNMVATQRRPLLTAQVHENCIATNRCERALSDERDCPYDDAVENTLKDWKALITASRSWVPGVALCGRCLGGFQRRHNALRDQTWNNLAEFFELDGVEWPVKEQT